MTIEEAIENMRILKPFYGGIAFEMAIQALEEIQQYRAIGTVEEFKALKEKKPISKNGISICPTCGALLRTET